MSSRDSDSQSLPPCDSDRQPLSSCDIERDFGLNNIYSDKVHDIHKYNVKIVGSDSKPVACLDHLLDML